MSLKKIKYYIIVLIVFLSWAHFACADLLVTEVNYNPEVKTDHLWIKVFNNDSTDVTLTDWSVADYDGTSWHYHTINADGPATLASNAYAIIAKASAGTITAFKTKNPNITDPLFYGNLTIGSEGTIGLSKDKKTIANQISYGGDNTPIDSTPVDDSIDNTDDTSTTTTTTNSSSTKVPEVLKITTKIISPKIVTAGIPFSINSLTTTNEGDTYAVGKYVWNFGDGMVSEKVNSLPFDYIYEYPGDYEVTLSYFGSVFSKTADATSKVTIKVVSNEISISSVGSDTDPFIEIENKSNYEILLSNWVITGGTHYFKIPDGTNILPNKKIKLSPKITGFVGEDIKSVVITNSSKEVVATYPAQNIKKPVQKNVVASLATYIKPVSSIKNDYVKESTQVINLNDLGADAEGSGALVPASRYAWIGLIIIIGLGVASFLLMKRKNNIEDYVEKEIRAEDMTIVE